MSDREIRYKIVGEDHTSQASRSASRELEGLGKASDGVQSRLGLLGAGLRRLVGPLAAGAIAVKAFRSALKFLGDTLREATGFESFQARLQGLVGGMRRARQEMNALTEGKHAVDDIFGAEGVFNASRSLRLTTGGALGGPRSVELAGEVAASTGAGIDVVAGAMGRLFNMLEDGDQQISRVTREMVRNGIITRAQANELEALAKEGAGITAVWGRFNEMLERHRGALENVRNTTEGYRRTADDAAGTAKRLMGEAIQPLANAYQKLRIAVWEGVTSALDPHNQRLREAEIAARREARALEENTREQEKNAAARKLSAASDAVGAVRQRIEEARISESTPAQQVSFYAAKILEMEKEKESFDKRQAEIRKEVARLEHARDTASGSFTPAMEERLDALKLEVGQESLWRMNPGAGLTVSASKAEFDFRQAQETLKLRQAQIAELESKKQEAGLAFAPSDQLRLDELIREQDAFDDAALEDVRNRLDRAQKAVDEMMQGLSDNLKTLEDEARYANTDDPARRLAMAKSRVSSLDQQIAEKEGGDAGQQIEAARLRLQRHGWQQRAIQEQRAVDAREQEKQREEDAGRERYARIKEHDRDFALSQKTPEERAEALMADMSDLEDQGRAARASGNKEAWMSAKEKWQQKRGQLAAVRSRIGQEKASITERPGDGWEDFISSIATGQGSSSVPRIGEKTGSGWQRGGFGRTGSFGRAGSFFADQRSNLGKVSDGLPGDSHRTPEVTALKENTEVLKRIEKKLGMKP